MANQLVSKDVLIVATAADVTLIASELEKVLETLDITVQDINSQSSAPDLMKAIARYHSDGRKLLLHPSYGHHISHVATRRGRDLTLNYVPGGISIETQGTCCDIFYNPIDGEGRQLPSIYQLANRRAVSGS